MHKDLVRAAKLRKEQEDLWGKVMTLAPPMNDRWRAVQVGHLAANLVRKFFGQPLLPASPQGVGGADSKS